MRRIIFPLSVGFLLFLGVSGVQGAWTDWALAETIGQGSCTVVKGLFGLLGVLAGSGALLRRDWAGSVALASAVAGGVTAGLSTVAWGGENLPTGLASGALGFLLGVLLYWGISMKPSLPV